MSSPQELLASLKNDAIFSDWKKQHEKAVLSHFFCALNADGQLKGNWEIGYYSSDKERITVFVKMENGFAIKPEDEVFSKEKPQIENLDAEQVKISITDAVKIFNEKKDELFPKQQLSDGFAILQVIEKKPLWNLTFVSKTLEFCNLRISADSGEVVLHQVVNIMQKNQAQQ